MDRFLLDKALLQHTTEMVCGAVWTITIWNRKENKHEYYTGFAVSKDGLILTTSWDDDTYCYDVDEAHRGNEAKRTLVLAGRRMNWGLTLYKIKDNSVQLEDHEVVTFDGENTMPNGEERVLMVSTFADKEYDLECEDFPTKTYVGVPGDVEYDCGDINLMDKIHCIQDLSTIRYDMEITVMSACDSIRTARNCTVGIPAYHDLHPQLPLFQFGKSHALTAARGAPVFNFKGRVVGMVSVSVHEKDFATPAKVLVEYLTKHCAFSLVPKIV